MLTSIIIENFRCFEKAEFSGFSLINVLGGENNAGKTALLEAIYLLNGDFIGSEDNPLYDIFRFRKFDINKFKPYLKDKIYDNLFWRQNIKNKIRLLGKYGINPNETMAKEIGYDVISKSLNIQSEKPELSSGIAATIGNFILQPNSTSWSGKSTSSPIAFLPTQYEMSNIDLVTSYEELDYKRKGDILLKAFQIINPDIESIKTYSYNPMSLHIARKGEEYLPISFFGDAMNKIAYYILHIIKVSKGILLIDEIENGIHHDHQRAFWKALLLLAKEYEVQIFATSHSLEMIQAYNDVALELEKEKPEFEGACHYFEMARHAKTQEITAIKMSMNMLQRKIVKNNPFRGE